MHGSQNIDHVPLIHGTKQNQTAQPIVLDSKSSSVEGLNIYRSSFGFGMVISVTGQQRGAPLVQLLKMETRHLPVSAPSAHRRARLLHLPVCTLRHSLLLLLTYLLAEAMDTLFACT